MAIKKRSRYSKSKVYGVIRTNRDGVKESRLYVAPKSLERVDPGRSTGVGFFSTSRPLDFLSMFVTKDHQDWWLIADASGVRDIFNLVDGDLIILPEISVFKDEA